VFTFGVSAMWTLLTLVLLSDAVCACDCACVCERAIGV